MKKFEQPPRRTPKKGRNNFKASLHSLVTHQVKLELPPRPGIKKK